MFARIALLGWLRRLKPASVAVLRSPSPDDVVFVELPEHMNAVEVEEFAGLLNDALPCRVVVLGGGARVTAIDQT